MSALPTGANTCILVHINYVVPAFRAMRMLTVDGYTIEDDSRTNPGPQRKKYETGILATTTTPVLAVTGGASIVGVEHRFAAGFFEFFTNREVSPSRQIGWLENHPGRNVHSPRCRQSNDRNIFGSDASVGNHLVDLLSHASHGIFGSTLAFGADRVVRNRLPVVIDQAEFNIRSADINAGVDWSLCVGRRNGDF